MFCLKKKITIIIDEFFTKTPAHRKSDLASFISLKKVFHDFEICSTSTINQETIAQFGEHSCLNQNTRIVSMAIFPSAPNYSAVWNSFGLILSFRQSNCLGRESLFVVAGVSWYFVHVN